MPSIISTSNAQPRWATSACRTPARRSNSAARPTTGLMATPSKPLPTATSWYRFAIRIGSSRSTTIRAKATAISSGVWATAAISSWCPPVQNGWFSHQHDPRFEPLSADRLMVLDNGNVRRDTDPKATTRGQVYQLDEQTKTATLVLNADLGRYSLARRIRREAVQRQLLVRRRLPARRLRHQRRSGLQRQKRLLGSHRRAGLPVLPSGRYVQPCERIAMTLNRRRFLMSAAGAAVAGGPAQSSSGSRTSS